MNAAQGQSEGGVDGGAADPDAGAPPARTLMASLLLEMPDVLIIDEARLQRCCMHAAAAARSLHADACAPLLPIHACTSLFAASHVCPL